MVLERYCGLKETEAGGSEEEREKGPEILSIEWRLRRRDHQALG